MENQVNAYLKSLFDLTGQVAVVTGASGGLGRHMAKALAIAGATVVVVGRRAEALNEVSDLIQSMGGRSVPRICDVGEASQTTALIEGIEAELGRLDVLVNGAGTTAMVHSLEMTEDQWDRVLDVNLKGAFFASQASARVMKKQGKGKILNVGSIQSAVGLPGRASYASSKGGVLLLTRTLATEWAQHGINVNAIGPGFYRTNINEHLFQNDAWRANLLRQIPMGRPGAPSDLEGITLFLASRASDYATGQIFYIDGGYLGGETNLNLPD